MQNQYPHISNFFSEDFANYQFVERLDNGGAVEYHFIDQSKAPGCHICRAKQDISNMQSKGYSPISYRHFMEDGKRSFIVVKKKKYHCTTCNTIHTASLSLVHPNVRFTTQYLQHLVSQYHEHRGVLSVIARNERIPITTMRKLYKQVLKDMIENPSQPSEQDIE